MAEIGGSDMSSHTVVRASIDEHLKEEASAVLAEMGLTVSDAFRFMMIRIAQEKTLPFDPPAPTETTIKAMKEARQGHVKAFDSLDDLMADLNEGKIRVS